MEKWQEYIISHKKKEQLSSIVNDSTIRLINNDTKISLRITYENTLYWLTFFDENEREIRVDFKPMEFKELIDFLQGANFIEICKNKKSTSVLFLAKILNLFRCGVEVTSNSKN